MSIEAGKTFGVTAREKGKKALNFSKRAVIPAMVIVGTIGFGIGGIVTALHLKEDKETRHSINTKVNEENPRKVSEEEYKLAKREVSGFNKIKDRYVDPNTSTLNVPQQIAVYNQLLEEDDARSQKASQQKNQLINEYKAKVGPIRTERDLAITFLFLAVFSAPFIGKKVLGKYRIKASFSEPTDP